MSVIKTLNKINDKVELKSEVVELTILSDFNKVYAASLTASSKTEKTIAQLKKEIDNAIKGYSKTLALGEVISSKSKELGFQVPVKVESDIKESKSEIAKLKAIKI